MADLAALKELHAWMKAEGIPYARTGDLELRLGPAAPPPAALIEPPLSDAEEERRSLETLLHSSGADITPFLSRRPP